MKIKVADFDEFVATLSKEERQKLQKAIWDYKDSHVKTVMVRKGQLVRYVVEGKFPECFVRIGVALDNYDNAKWFSVLEYLDEKYDCYRTSNVEAYRVVEVLDEYMNLTRLEEDYKKPISYEEYSKIVEKNTI